MVAHTASSQESGLLEEGGLEGQHVGGDLHHAGAGQGQSSGDGEACSSSSSDCRGYSQALINGN